MGVNRQQTGLSSHGAVKNVNMFLKIGHPLLMLDERLQ